MSTVTTPPARVTVTGLDDCLTLDPARPLYVCHVRGPLTLSVVSIAWLQAIGDRARTALESRHLSDAESAQARQLPLPKRRLEWLAGRLALKHGVCAYQRRHFDARTGTRDVHISAVADGLRAGRPWVDFPVEVGLSHSVDFAVAACGPRAVGIDVERTRRMPPMLTELLTRTPGAAKGTESVGVRAMPLSLRWACKEAVLKHFGFGLRVDPQEVELTGWRPDGRFSWRAGPGLRRHVSQGDGARFDSWAREVDGYSVALVWR
ncbi:4'-phosphopantetheinyl transferase family protein [Streptomyces ferrugineus]|uniref:4'-phosphopantetheinyl transferase family protein n=1 Tax=Streptomyces ferrugineus TaxID=1413221 RepID=UPI001D13909A|nr:4'-phosphopantetheinyl transferase superfamily protein [Streptomyces ferrugineus]